MSYCYPRLMFYQPCVTDDGMSPTIYIYIYIYIYILHFIILSVGQVFVQDNILLLIGNVQATLLFLIFYLQKLSTQTKSSDDYDYVESRFITNGNGSTIKQVMLS